MKSPYGWLVCVANYCHTVGQITMKFGTSSLGGSKLFAWGSFHRLQIYVLFMLSNFSKILRMEEEFIEKMCAEVIAVKPDLVITEKGVSDLAQHYLVKAGISVIRRVRKSDNNRIAR